MQLVLSREEGEGVAEDVAGLRELALPLEEGGELEAPLFVLPEGEPLQERIRTWVPWIGIGFAAAARAAGRVFG